MNNNSANLREQHMIKIEEERFEFAERYTLLEIDLKLKFEGQKATPQTCLEMRDFLESNLRAISKIMGGRRVPEVEVKLEQNKHTKAWDEVKVFYPEVFAEQDEHLYSALYSYIFDLIPKTQDTEQEPEVSPTTKALLGLASEISEYELFKTFFEAFGIAYGMYPIAAGREPKKLVLEVAQSNFHFDIAGKYLGVEQDEMKIFEPREVKS